MKITSNALPVVAQRVITSPAERAVLQQDRATIRTRAAAVGTVAGAMLGGLAASTLAGGNAIAGFLVGAGIGALSGAVTGGVLAHAAWGHQEGFGSIVGLAFGIQGGAIVGGVAGACTGPFVGAAPVVGVAAGAVAGSLVGYAIGNRVA
ncbi:MAG: hypothetical protein HY319_23255 [Armatimonadetes bacterium]|nr:hypothetical protein [Armatimonadota bacterium]